MTHTFQTISPIDGSVVAERAHATDAEVDAALERAVAAAGPWARTPLEERRRLVAAMVEAIVGRAGSLGDELTRQMGRPIRYSPREISGGFAERGRAMVAMAPDALADIVLPDRPGFRRFIRRAPLGPTLVLAPWNYPWLTAVNTVVPSLLCGNPVLLKHSEQTPLVPERWGEAAREAGLPDGVFQFLHTTHEQSAVAVADPRVAHVSLTGSVAAGHAVHRAAAGRFIACGLELGGKDPAYVRADANLDFAVENLVDGAFFNSGQSCCGIERIYVHADRYDRFVEGFAALTERYVLGDPTEPDTTLGPVVREAAARFVEAQVEAAVAAGARSIVDPARFAEGTARGPCYVAPRVLVDVTHDMELMTEETFGPAVGIMRVSSDDEAVRLMNDSRYGLTASIWTEDVERAVALGERVETGTWFLNRCDYLDPELAWVGVKDSGRGCTLSRVGFESLTRPKSFHLRLET